MKKLPSRIELMSLTIEAISQLGGSANTDEIYEKIVENLKLGDALLEIINGKTGQSELKYNLAWVRTVLKNQGAISNGGKGIWVLSENMPNRIVSSKNTILNDSEEKEADEEVADAEKWKMAAIDMITEKMSPAAFERLI